MYKATLESMPDGAMVIVNFNTIHAASGDNLILTYYDFQIIFEVYQTTTFNETYFYKYNGQIYMGISCGNGFLYPLPPMWGTDETTRIRQVSEVLWMQSLAIL